MLRNAALAAALATSLLGVAACVPTTTFQGFQIIDHSPTDVKVGEDRAAVLAKLGTPTETATFDKEIWYYLSQATSKTAFYHPRAIRRSVVAINFDKSAQVSAVNIYTLSDGRIIAYNSHETPTRGREMSIIEQLIGSIGTASALPQDQNVSPGAHPDNPH